MRYVNGKAVNGRSVDDVLKDLVGDEGQTLEISFRAADEAKSQVRWSNFYKCLLAAVLCLSPLHTTMTQVREHFRSCSLFALLFPAAAAAEMVAVAELPEAKLSVWRPLLNVRISHPPHSFFLSSPGVGISFVRRAGAAVGADSKFVVKRLVQGSDTAMQGDVEVNDVVVRVRAFVPLFIFHFDGHLCGGCRLTGTRLRGGTKRRYLLMSWEKKVGIGVCRRHRFIVMQHLPIQC